MASEYLKKKYQDVKPDEPKQLTPKEKRANWLYYHRIHFLVAAIAILVVIGFVKDVIMKVEPDYQIGYISDVYLDSETQEAIEAELAKLGEDRDGDGRVIVQLNCYVLNEQDPNLYTTQIALMGDISVGNSEYYLVPDPVAFQRDYGILTMSDGSIFDEGMDPNLCVRYKVADCAAFDAFTFQQDLYLTQRQFASEKDQEAHASSESLWTAMTAGASAVKE